MNTIILSSILQIYHEILSDENETSHYFVFSERVYIYQIGQNTTLFWFIMGVRGCTMIQLSSKE